MHSSRNLTPYPEVVEDLYAPIIGVDDQNAIVSVDEQACGQLEVTETRAALTEVVQQLSLPIEYLDHVI